ncbi:MAG: RHS repeat domain-containing protein, partial [Candidatus Limnocylindria bacterium]
DPGTFAQYDPQIGISGAGDLLVIWQDDRVPNTEVRLRRRLAGQSNWQASTVASDAAAIPVSLALGVRSDGNAFAAWQDARGSSYDIWGADYTFATNSWTTSALVSDDPGNTAQMRPAAALSANEVALAWRDDRVTGGDLRSRRRAGTQGVDHSTYTYDGLNRLTSAGGALAESFVLDPASNIASRTGPPATYAYDASNRLTSDGSRTFVWDAADRLALRGSDSFTFDAAGRLASVTAGGSTRSFSYSADSLLSSVSAGVAVPVLWDVSADPARVISHGADRVIHGLGPLYVDHAGADLALARDALGSVRAEVNSVGVPSASFRYQVYGKLASTNGSPLLLGYAGEMAQLSVALVYLRARWYDAETARFISRDSVAGEIARPHSLDLYTYGGANPVRYGDPTGNGCVGLQIGGAAVAGMLLFAVNATGAFGAGICVDAKAGVTAGGFAYGGGFIGTPFGSVSFPGTSSIGNVALGRFVGGGGGIFASDAPTISSLVGPFDTISFDSAVGSISYATSGSIHVFEISPGLYGRTLIGPAAISRLQTYTWTTPDVQFYSFARPGSGLPLGPSPK